MIEKLVIANDNRKEIKVHSPVELRVKDSKGGIVGIIHGEVVNTIDTAVYDPSSETVAIFFPDDTYTYQVVGDGSGKTYGFEIQNMMNESTQTIFQAVDLPITKNEIHTYFVDENKLKELELLENAEK